MRIALASLFAICYLLFAIPQAEAAFSQAYIRLDRLKASTALSGLVCAKPASSGTEAKVSIEFPSDFTISSSTSNWTASTSDIPTGATAWSGIGSTATSVSSQTVTFASSDLTVGTLYCFNFSSSSSSTGSSGEKSGTITSKNSSDTTIDSTNYAVSIVANDQITVSATVPPDTWDFQNSLSSPTGGEVSQDKEVEYKINYGLNSSSSSDITLQAQWYQGTIEGEGSESVDILEYVVGSAEKAYNSTNPTIDTVNRKITWTISSFPGLTTDKTVSFKLRTTSNYTGGKIVSFNVKSRVISGTSSSTDSSIGKKYKYVAPTSSPTPTPSPSPTPSISSSFIISGIEVREISDDSATIFVSTSKNTSLRISFGEALNRLGNAVISDRSSTTHLINLENLKNDTNYFFRVAATDNRGITVNSDIFTFKTADVGELPKIDEDTLVVTSGDNVIYGTQTSKMGKAFTIIIKDTAFQFKFALKGKTPAKKVEAIVRNKKVLGLSTFIVPQAEANTEIAEVIEVEPNVYIGRLKTKPEPGLYEVYLRIIDYLGNISEYKLLEIKVTNPLTIFSKSDKSPLEGVRILLSIYNSKTRLFDIISPTSLAISNPSFTNGAGEVDFVLPFGIYKAHLSNLGYKDMEIEFSLGDKESDGYPIAYLEGEGFNLLNTLIYYGRSFRDVFLTTTYQYILILGSSIRFFHLVSSLVLASLVAVTLFAFSKKHGIPLSQVHSSFLYLLHKNIRPKAKNYISGRVTDENDKGVASANVYLLNQGVEEIIGSTKTNRDGEFFFKKSGANSDYLIMAMKEGYKTHPLLPYEPEEKDFKIIVSQNFVHQHSPLHYMKHLLEGGIGIYFEALLLFSFFFELLFIQAFGINKALPFVAVSLFNLFFWLLYIRHHHKHASA